MRTAHFGSAGLPNQLRRLDEASLHELRPAKLREVLVDMGVDAKEIHRSHPSDKDALVALIVRHRGALVAQLRQLR